MKQIAKKIAELKLETEGYEAVYSQREKEYKDFVKKVEDHYKNKINVQKNENKNLIDKITGM